LIPPILYSFHYLANGNGTLKDLLDRQMRTEGCCVMIDSGAFSAHRLGIRIRLTRYIEACKYYLDSPQIWGCIQLDVVGNAAGTKRNLDAMVKAGVRPMPVLTVDAHIDSLAALQQINKRICVAGALGKFTGAETWIEQRYRSAHAAAPAAQLHGLGFIRWPNMYGLGLSSCDSSSHSAGERYGLMSRFNRNSGVLWFGNRHWKDRTRIPRDWIAWMRDCGCSKADLNDDSIMAAGAASFCSISCSVAHGLWSVYSQRYGVRSFLASSNWIAAARIMIGLRYALPDGRFDFHKARALLQLCRSKPKQRIDLISETFEVLRAKANRVCID